MGLSGASKLFKSFSATGHLLIFPFHVPVVAVDLKAGKEVHLREGKVADAILSDHCRTWCFSSKTAWEYAPGGWRRTQPGAGMCCPFHGCDSSSGGSDPGWPWQNPRGGLNNLPLHVPVPARLVERLTHTRVAQAFNIFLQSVDVGSRQLAELRLLADRPEVVIRPNVGGVGLLDKVEVSKIVHMGELAAEAALPELRRAVTWPNRFRRRVFPRK